VSAKKKRKGALAVRGGGIKPLSRVKDKLAEKDLTRGTGEDLKRAYWGTWPKEHSGFLDQEIKSENLSSRPGLSRGEEALGT